MRAPSARPGDLRIGTASGVAALATEVAGANEEFGRKASPLSHGARLMEGNVPVPRKV